MNEDTSLTVSNNSLAVMEGKIKRLFGKQTPKTVIKQRQGAGGRMFAYVPIDYVVKELDDAFGIFWEFITDDVRVTSKQVIVRGRLVVKSPDGFSISRPGTGRANIKFYQGTKDPVDEGNDEKAATSDAIKKAASLYGIASDVYYKELEKYEDIGDVQQDKEEIRRVMARFFAVAAQYGFSSEDAKKRIKEIYRKEHMEELTVEQIETTIKNIEKYYEVVEPGEAPRKKGQIKISVPEKTIDAGFGMSVPVKSDADEFYSKGEGEVAKDIIDESIEVEPCPNPQDIKDCKGILGEGETLCKSCRFEEFLRMKKTNV